jgi:biopolymer transport protein ExbD
LETWDVFHADRLEVERSLSTAAVREALARGDLRDDDLIRPAGTTVPWARLADLPALLESPPEAAAGFEAGAAPGPAEEAAPPTFADDRDDEEDEPYDAAVPGPEDEDDDAVLAEGLGRDDLDLREDESHLALPVVAPSWDEPEEEYDPLDEDEEAAEFTLSRNAPQRVEELDLAAMVDVAFQLVLFFIVTATTVLYKSLEVPKPNAESPAAAQQGRSRGLDDLQDDYILVEIDPAGAMKVDREPVAADMGALVERLRQAREKTHRKAMLLMADTATPHRHAVLAYDAANEIGLGIAIARPQGAPPSPPPAPAPKKRVAG